MAVAAIDLAGPRAADHVSAAAAAELGAVDVLVNNAAVELQRRFVDLDTEEIERVVRVDLITPIALTRLLLGLEDLVVVASEPAQTHRRLRKVER